MSDEQITMALLVQAEKLVRKLGNIPDNHTVSMEACVDRILWTSTNGFGYDLSGEIPVR